MHLNYPEIEAADSEKQYLQNCIKSVIDSSKVPNESTVVLLTSRAPHYYTIIGTIVYYHRAFYGTAYVSGGKRYRLAGRKTADTQEDFYEIIDDRYSIAYEDKVITTDLNGYFHLNDLHLSHILNVYPIGQVDGKDVSFEIVRGENNQNYIRFKNSEGEYYKTPKSCSARIYSLAWSDI